MRKSSVAAGFAAVLVSAALPAAAPADEHPAGCKANGQAVATAAQMNRPFGQVVVMNAPINDDVVGFKLALCGT